MCIVIANQCVENYIVEQAQYLRCIRACDTAHQRETLRKVWATLVLVFHFWHHTQCLAEVLLVQALPTPIGICYSVVALNQQELAIMNGVDL